MHVVFIVGSYYPYYSAVGKCVGNVADELSKTHQVTVICEKSVFDQSDEEVYNGQNIIRLTTKETRIRFRLEMRLQRAKGYSKKIHGFFFTLCKLAWAAKTILSRVSIKQELVERYIERLRNIETPIDVIIPSSMPFESVVAATQYKRTSQNEAKLVPYIFDQFTDSRTLHRLALNRILKRDRHVNLEKEIYSAVHSILAMHSHNAFFSKYLANIRNIHYIEHPLVVKRELAENCKANEIKISYIGGLYRNYVVPDYLLKVFEMVDLEEAQLNFYIIGNCDSAVNKYCRRLPNKIINHGSVDKATADQEVVNSNILVSIAEKRGIQLSSKIFEYMSRGKPIIHFYTVDNDVNIHILKKYPIALCLKQDVALMNENAKKFETFCRVNSNEKLAFEEVAKLFADANPKHTARLIERIVLD